jgi:hypothetical protein
METKPQSTKRQASLLDHWKVDSEKKDEPSKKTKKTKKTNVCWYEIIDSEDEDSIIIVESDDDEEKDKDKDTKSDNVLPTATPYYVKNFLQVCDNAVERHASILHEKELSLFKQWRNDLSLGAQIIYVRCYSRTGPWFRENDLESKYGEKIPGMDVGECISELIRKRWMVEYDANRHDVTEMMSMMARPELSSICNHLNVWKLHGIKKSSKKEDIIRVLEKHVHQRSVFEHWGKGIPSKHSLVLRQALRLCTRITSLSKESVALFQMLERLSFLFCGEDLFSLVLSNLSICTFPQYKVWESDRSVFETRDALDEYFESLQIRDKLLEIIDENDAHKCKELLLGCVCPQLEEQERKLENECSAMEMTVEDREKTHEFQIFRRFTSGYVYSCALTAAISLLEKHAEYAVVVDALQIVVKTHYSIGRRGFWYVSLLLFVLSFSPSLV